MLKKTPLNLLFVATALFCSSGLKAEPIKPGCETVANTQGVCGFPAPEDIDVLPGDRYLLLAPVAGMGNGDKLPLYTFDTQGLTAAPVQYSQPGSEERWGDAACMTAPDEKFSPHGVHVAKRAAGQWQVLAVNHQRESVEMFEVMDQAGIPSLAWRGCVMMPDKGNINDVVALPDGGFLVSHMFDRGTMDVMVAMQATENTGYVWRWRPGLGLDKLPGSEGIVPNGVALSADAQSVFIAETGGQKIRKLNYQSGKEEGSVVLGPVDNISWAADGRLIATQVTGPMPEDCFSSPGPCLAPFNVVAIDPDSLEFEVLHQQQGKPMGAASVAVVLNDVIYVGSFKGHQLLRISMAKPASARVSLPSAGDKGFPFMSTAMDLSPYGYTEQEFFISGQAQAYIKDGEFSLDGKWHAKPNEEAITPYRTRILVRRPGADKFNGSVIVEWMNVSSGMDVTPDWSMAHVEYLREGYAYVAVSAQYVGIEFMRQWDSKRYSELHHPGDTFSYDIFSQVGEVLIHPKAGEPQPLGNLTSMVKAIIANGESQSAARLLTYVNAVHPLKPVYQGFLIHSWLGGADLSQETAGVEFSSFWKTIKPPKGVPATTDIEVPDIEEVFIRTDNPVPVLIVNSETDVGGIFGSYAGFRTQPDSEYFRLWEIAGTAHADQYVFSAGTADGVKSDVSFPIECSGAPINGGPQTYAIRAAVHALNRWVRHGEPAPGGPRLELDGSSLARNPLTGIVTSGIQLPQVAVPTATYTGKRPWRSVFSSPFCILFGASDPWNGDTDEWDNGWLLDPFSGPEPDIKKLYVTKADYLEKYTAALDQAVQAGYIRPADRAEIYNEALASDYWD